MLSNFSKHFLSQNSRFKTTTYRNNRAVLLEVLRMRKGVNEIPKNISYKDKLLTKKKII